MAAHCPLCDGKSPSDGWGPPRFCVKVGADAPQKCWLHSPSQELRWCAQSMAGRMKGHERRANYLLMLRGLGGALQMGEPTVASFLATLSPEQRSTLLKYCVSDLSASVAKRIALLPSPEVRPEQATVRIPESLPASLRDGLLAFEKRLRLRYEALTKRGHSRSPKYVMGAMKMPIRLAVFLASEGIDRWDVVRKRDLVAFFQRNPSANRQPIERFLRSLEDHRPFQERRGRPAGGKKLRDRNQKPPPQVLRPEVLTEFLADVRERYSAQEYLLAWMVCRLGMIARHAYSITLDRVRLNERGQVVIRPARVWVEVPDRVSKRFIELIASVDPNWATADPETLRHVTIFDRYIPNLDAFSSTVLQGRTRLLRLSAVFAAMLDGHLDRVTLRHTIGVSMPTILQLERLLAIDLHRRVDPELVKARNAHIRGQSSE